MLKDISRLYETYFRFSILDALFQPSLATQRVIKDSQRSHTLSPLLSNCDWPKEELNEVMLRRRLTGIRTNRFSRVIVDQKKTDRNESNICFSIHLYYYLLVVSYRNYSQMNQMHHYQNNEGNSMVSEWACSYQYFKRRADNFIFRYFINFLEEKIANR